MCSTCDLLKFSNRYYRIKNLLVKPWETDHSQFISEDEERLLSSGFISVITMITMISKSITIFSSLWLYSKHYQNVRTWMFTTSPVYRVWWKMKWQENILLIFQAGGNHCILICDHLVTILPQPNWIVENCFLFKSKNCDGSWPIAKIIQWPMAK